MTQIGTNSEHKVARKRSTKREMALRDARLIRALAAGQSIEEVAAREAIPLRRARERVSAILSRNPDPPAEFANLQMRRLSEAMIVASAAMSQGNLEAVDRVLRITREFDRYAGLAEALAAAAPPPSLAPTPAPPLALAPPALPPPLICETAQRDLATG
jgi:hypothetical protein